MQNVVILAAFSLVEKQRPRRERKKFSLVLMGVLAPGSAHSGPSALPPIDTSGEYPGHMPAEFLRGTREAAMDG